MKLDAAFGTFDCYANLFRSPARAYRPKLIFLPPTVCFFLKVTTVAHIIRPISAVLTFVEHRWPQPNLSLSKHKHFET